MKNYTSGNLNKLPMVLKVINKKACVWMQVYNALKYTLVTTKKYCLPRPKRFTVYQINSCFYWNKNFLSLVQRVLEREIDSG